MNKKEILERVINLINPKLQETINNLEIEEYNYLINHLATDLERSLHHWKFKTQPLPQNINPIL